MKKKIVKASSNKLVQILGFYHKELKTFFGYVEEEENIFADLSQVEYLVMVYDFSFCFVFLF